MKSSGYFLLLFSLKIYCQESPPDYSLERLPTYQESETQLAHHVPNLQTTNRTRLYEEEGNFLRRQFHNPHELLTPFTTHNIDNFNFTLQDRLSVTTHNQNEQKKWLLPLNDNDLPLLVPAHDSTIEQIYHNGPEKLYATARFYDGAIHLLTTTENGTIRHDYAISMPEQTTQATPQLYFNPFKKEFYSKNNGTSWNRISFNTETVVIEHNAIEQEHYTTNNTQIIFSPTGHLAFVDEHSITIKNPADPNFFSFFENSTTTHFAFNPNHQKAQFLMQKDEMFDIYTIHTGNTVASSNIEFLPHNVHFSGTGNYIIGLRKDQLNLDIINTKNFWSVAVFTLSNPAKSLTCSTIPTSDAYIILMDKENMLYYSQSCNRRERSARYKGTAIKKVVFNPDNDKKFAIQEGNNHLRFFDFTQQNELSRYNRSLTDPLQKEAFVGLIKMLLKFKNGSEKIIDPTEEDILTKTFLSLPIKLQKMLIDKKFIICLEPPNYETINKRKIKLLAQIAQIMTSCFNRNK